MIRENERKVPSGYLMIVVLFLAEAATVYWFVQELQAISVFGIIAASTAMTIVFVFWFGFFMVHPNEARVSFTLEIYDFVPRFAPRDATCQKD